ncbi:hypothetical protein Vafri_6615, partial [Volvox africanus]
ALLGVLEEPASLGACPQLVRQVMLLEPYVSHALYDSSGGSDATAATTEVAMSRWALLAAMHLEQVMLLQEGEEGGGGDGGATVAGAASKGGASQPHAAACKAASAKTRPKSKFAVARAVTDAASGADPGSASGADVRAVATADGLGTIDVREHTSRAKALLRRLLAEAVMLGMVGILGTTPGDQFAWTDSAAEAADVDIDADAAGGGGGGGNISSWAPPSTYALLDMAAQDAGANIEHQGIGLVARGPASVETSREKSAALALVHRRAMSMYRWLWGHLLELENRVLEAQESYLQCLGALPEGPNPAIAFTGGGGAHPEFNTAQTGLNTTTPAGYDGVKDRWWPGEIAVQNQRGHAGTDLDSACGSGGIWPGCWALPGCSILQPPTAAAVQVRVRALDVFRTMASAEQLVASGEYKQAVLILRDVGFPQRQPRVAVGSGAAAAAASPDVEDLPSGAAVQAADAEAGGDGSPVIAASAARNQARVQVRAVQLLKEALTALLHPRPPQLQPAPPVPVPPAPPQREEEQRQDLHPDGPQTQRDVSPALAAASGPNAAPSGHAVVAIPAAATAA